MAVFMDTGGGDIYAGETEQACLTAMRDDLGDADFEEIKAEVFKVPGDTKMRVENEDGSDGPLSTIAEEYTNLGYGYCIASTNCLAAQDRVRVLEEALRKYVGVRDGFGKISANLTLGLPCDHEFYCHNPDDQDNGCLHDTEGRMKHPCKHCGKTRAALNREARF